ncbi:uncharacterized protein LOC121645528 [Melanotaenia boesemani]|uniref:uncharacterized protein LOC121645528 n=1 Tax=Melanotaenia boesemani TaxID=1250792 RepID=UPI001C05CC70|nr:uncharacterized protein LOC121645528 [Melanotaenia boesemani]
MDELRRTGRSPDDMASQLKALHIKYERAHMSYLSTVKNVLDGDSGLYGQRTITGTVRTKTTPPFGGYDDTEGWYGVAVTSHYLDDCFIQEYRRQENTLNLFLQGTFGQVLRADHTCKIARKVVLTSGTMLSYAVMNENWMILSWVMLQSENDKSLEPMYEELPHPYISAGQEKAKYQWVDRDCCAAFRIPNPKPQEHLSRTLGRPQRPLSLRQLPGDSKTTVLLAKSTAVALVSSWTCFIACDASPESAHQSTTHCTALFPSSCQLLFVLLIRPTYKDLGRSMFSVGLCHQIQQSNT